MLSIKYLSPFSLQMQYFGDNFDFLCLYLIVIINKISIEQAQLVENFTIFPRETNGFAKSWTPLLYPLSYGGVCEVDISFESRDAGTRDNRLKLY